MRDKDSDTTAFEMRYDHGVDTETRFNPEKMDSSDSEKEDEKKGWFWCCEYIQSKRTLFRLIKTAIPVTSGMNFKAKWQRFFAQSLIKRNEDKADPKKYAFSKFNFIKKLIMIIAIPLIIQSYL